MASWNLANYGSGDGLLPDGTMPLYEPVLQRNKLPCKDSVEQIRFERITIKGEAFKM